jgi:hypothetical protein
MDLGALWWQEVGGWVVIVTVIGWFVVSLGLDVFGRRKTRDLKTGRISEAWWLGRRSRRRPPGPFLKS